MSYQFCCNSVLAALAFCTTLLLTGKSLAEVPSSSRIQANCNRTPAGAWENGVLDLHLELRPGDWYPEAETGPGLKLYAFAEEGKAAQVPGPLIRVPEGPEIQVSLRNSLPSTTVIHGLHQHPGDVNDVIKLAPGEQRELHFAVGGRGHLPILGQHRTRLESQPPCSPVSRR
jgi:FtsP/CotA-like multicopper oxidase with cupredoxin domain